jgi:UDP-N-acetylmuramyl pentapeptide synthase
VSLPVVLLRLDVRHQAAVLEMATRGQGQLEYLASLALPSIGAVTTVAPVHIETLGSLAGVASAKAELLRSLPAGGLAVYNADSAELRAELARGGVDAPMVGFGFGAGADVRAESATTVFTRSGNRVEASLTFSVACRPGAPAERLGLPTVGSLQVTIPYPGRHNVTNVLAAALVAAAVGVPFAEGLNSLSRFRPKSAMRLDIATVGDRVLIDDAYNANLLSMTAALEVLAGVAASGRRIAVLADMLELGPIEAETHRELGRQVPKWGVDLLVCVGPASRATAQVAIGEGMAAENVFWTDDRQVAADYVLRNAQPGDAVLVKGSRGMAMEYVVSALRQGWQA